MRNAWITILAVSALATGSAKDQKPATGPATFRSDARLVRVSVVVHDRQGQPVSGLTADDFELIEDRQRQTVSLFSVEGAASGLRPPTGANTISNRIDGPSSTGVTVLLYDRLNTRFEHQHQARAHIINYLKQLRPGDRVGFYALESDSIRVLHDFSRDASSLLKALDRTGPVVSRELSGSEDKLPALEPIGIASIDAQMQRWLLESERQVQGFFTERRVKATAGAMEAIARHLAGVRGRKNVIWVSSGFPIRFHDGISERTTSADIYRATRALNDADIAFYPVDARGLVGVFSTPASARQQEFVTLNGVMNNIDASQLIAEQTGGRAFFNTNDLGGAIIRAAQDSRLTYVLGYYPSHGQWDGRFREIKVLVRRRSVDVRHRKGYFAFPPQPADAGNRQNALIDALSSPLDATGAAISVSFEKTATEGQFTLAIRVASDSVLLQKSGDAWIGALDVAIAQALPDGRLFDSLDVTVPLRLSDATRQQILRDGLTFSRTLALREDAHEVKVAVQDTSGALGTVTIPASRFRGVKAP